MIKCRTWAPLRHTYSEHKTTEDALEYVLDMLDSLINKIDWNQKGADKIYELITNEKYVNNMYTLFDTGIIDKIKSRK